eukprot:2341176-Amphidinium_carterae.1
MHDVAKKRGGRCLSQEYSNSRALLHWQCSYGHEWRASLASVNYKGTWCPHCSNRVPAGLRVRASLELARELARVRGGLCLSSTCSRVKEKLTWQCSHGHVWKASFASVKAKTWCPQCASNAPLNIDDATAVAKARGGHCLSESYIACNHPLLWQCSCGHVWSASLNSTRNMGT